MSELETEIDEIDDADCLDIESADENVTVSKLKISKSGWTNEDLIPKDAIRCIIPKSLYIAIKSIEKSVNAKFTSRNEFSIYIHGDYNDDGDIVVSEEYYIPKQVVSTASVDYLEDPAIFYNGCLHKHPDGYKSFSGTDKTYINSNFEFSLLYVDHKIHMGIVNINYHGNKKLQTKLQIVVEDDSLYDVDVCNVLKEDPNKKPVVVNSGPGLLLPGFQNPNDKELILPNFYNGPNIGSLDMDSPDILESLGYDI